jgi:hypothetical protein
MTTASSDDASLTGERRTTGAASWGWISVATVTVCAYMPSKWTRQGLVQSMNIPMFQYVIFDSSPAEGISSGAIGAHAK